MSNIPFRQRHFPSVPARDWNDWRWQLRNAAATQEQLAAWIKLTPTECAAWRGKAHLTPLRVTPYYASLFAADPDHPLRRVAVPLPAEHLAQQGEFDDPLGEEAHRPTPCIVHTYPDKALFLATDQCAMFCRFCTRARLLGQCAALSCRAEWQRGLDYLRAHPEIRDVLISGGDPLMLSDSRLDWLLGELRGIPHLEFIRFGTKVPASLPQRVTPALARILKKHGHPWLVIHFTHPAELTAACADACALLADHGVVLASQTVLLKGVNDDAVVIRNLCQQLLKLRVRPYYLHQCDAVSGSAHFKTTIQQGMEIMRQLHGHTTGLAVPLYMLDAPGGGGKVPLTPGYIHARRGSKVTLRNYLNKEYVYQDA